MIKTALYLEQFILGAFGKGCYEVHPHRAAAVVEYVEYDEKQYVAHHVMHPHGQQRQHIPYIIYNVIEYLHAFFAYCSFM